MMVSIMFFIVQHLLFIYICLGFKLWWGKAGFGWLLRVGYKTLIASVLRGYIVNW